MVANFTSENNYLSYSKQKFTISIGRTLNILKPITFRLSPVKTPARNKAIQHETKLLLVLAGSVSWPCVRNSYVITSARNVFGRVTSHVCTVLHFSSGRNRWPLKASMSGAYIGDSRKNAQDRIIPWMLQHLKSQLVDVWNSVGSSARTPLSCNIATPFDKF
jgi:hypothetical protein